MRYKGGRLAKQVVGVCLIFGGCLPLGKAPEGQHVAHDRTLTGVFLTASEQDGVAPFLLATGSTREPLSDEQSAPFPSDMKVADVYAFRYGDGRPLVEGLAGQAPVLQDLDLPTGYPGTFSSDSRGRLVYVKRQVDASPIYDRVERLDLVTGQVDDAGQNVWIESKPSFLLSADRTRLFAGSTGLSVVLGEGGTEDHLGWVASTNAAFVDNDLYYLSAPSPRSGEAPSVSAGSYVMRCRPGMLPETLASSSGELRLTPIFGDQTPQVLVSLVTDAGNAPLALLDTSTLKSTPFRGIEGQVQFMAASSNGQWLLFVAPGEGVQTAATALAYVLYSWVSEASYRIVGLPVSASVESDWRPGHDELWFALGDYASYFGVWAAEVSPSSYRSVTGKGSLSTFPWADGRKSMFTRDGALVVLVEHRLKDSVGTTTFSIGPADDLEAPRTVLNSEGNELKSLWETMDGRVLAGVGQAQSDRQDLLLIDPSTSTSRLVGSGGHGVAVGRTRMLTLLNWESSRGTGDLVLVDLATGEKSVLAESVYAVALDPGRLADASPDIDRLDPGTRVSYLVRDRLESPYDGLWVARLP